MTKPNFELSIDTRLIYQALIQKAEGETATYDEIGNAVSRKIA